jgi:hypothetical protein
MECAGALALNKVFVADVLVPRAEVSGSNFNVTSQDLCRLWSTAKVDLLPVGTVHTHPGSGKPSASGVDEDNDMDQSSLYHLEGMRAQSRELVLKPVNPEANAAVVDYLIDDYRKVVVTTNGEDVPDVTFQFKYDYRLWASIILNADADFTKAAGYIMEHRYARSGQKKPVILRYGNVPVQVISNREMAERSGIPAESVNLEWDEEALRREVNEKLTVCKYAYAGYGGSYYNAGGYGYPDRQTAYTYNVYDWNRNKTKGAYLPATQDNDAGFYVRNNLSTDEIARMLREAVGFVQRNSYSFKEKGWKSPVFNMFQAAAAIEECARQLRKNLMRN